MRLAIIIFYFAFLCDAWASELSTNFISSPERQIFYQDSKCLGFFGCAGNPGAPQYCSITVGDDGKKIFLNFYEYCYNEKKLILKNKNEISESLVSDLFMLLRENVLNATDIKQKFVLDGWNIEFGIRQEQWKFAGTNTPASNSIAYYMGKIGISRDINEVKENLKEALLIKENKTISKKKTLTAPDGYEFSNTPSTKSASCQTDKFIWTIKVITKKEDYHKIILYRISKNFERCQEFEIPIKTSQYTSAGNLSPLSDQILPFYFSYQRRYRNCI